MTEPAASRDVSVSLCALKPLLGLKLDFWAQCKKIVEDESETGEDRFHAVQIEPGANKQLAAEILIPCDDLDQMPFEPGSNEMLHSPIAIVVDPKAFQLVDSVYLRLWWICAKSSRTRIERK